MSLEADAVDTELRSRLFGFACLAIDVESDPGHGDRIFRLGAVRSDTGDCLDAPVSALAANRSTLIARLNALTVGADMVVGHNYRRHDAPLLSAQMNDPALTALGLPLIDTLELSPLAFPRNPYHRLVKGYRLATQTRNDPLADARATLELLADEMEAFAALSTQDPPWFALLRFLLDDEPALSRLLTRIDSSPVVDAAQAGVHLRTRFDGIACVAGLSRLAAQLHERRRASAYALGWLRVAGGNSVLHTWVNAAMPDVRRVITELRETDCGLSHCTYCHRQHSPESLLFEWFQKPNFRRVPENGDGGSLQRDIVVAGLARRSLLAIMPTGGGKSICYQLPALAHYGRSGRLTVIISPLQSLMKDQVDNLVASGVHCAVTINGLLTAPERRWALDRIALGDAGIVLVSPEQFRNRAFTEAIRSREIATWVFDEAHCLSKWGHDFRTDYLYVARFIREQFGAQGAAVACFTATARLDVIDDLIEHFRVALGLTLEKHLGGHQRPNLEYLVVPVTRGAKAQRIAELLGRELRDGGAAVIFCATRRHAELQAEWLSASGIRCAHFHGGLTPVRKKEIQRAFIANEIDVIAATNAFGMGVDKPNIRVVVHAEIPGSLENYLQEAGRAGRDGAPARCVLLFDEQDVETQFRLAASSQLTPKDFVGLLKGIRRRAERFHADEIVVSAGELLLDADGTDIDIDARDATTKVTTAIAWLERSGFLMRNENRSKVFPTSLRVASLADALRLIHQAGLKGAVRRTCEAVMRFLFRDLDATGLGTDELMVDAGVSPDDCFRTLHTLEQLGVLTSDLGLKAEVSKGIRGASDIALARLARVEHTLLEAMAEMAPDADADGTPQLLGIRPLCGELRRRIESPDIAEWVTPDRVQRCLRSMSESFGSAVGQRSMLQLRRQGSDSLRVVLHRRWSQIREICALRRGVAQVLLAALMAKLPDSSRGRCLVECRTAELLAAIDGDIELRTTLRDPATAMEHALLYLHDTEVIQLDKGRTIFRAAMTIALTSSAGAAGRDDRKRRFLKDDFAPLREHYRARTMQTHVMHEYAKLGLQQQAAALAMVAAYFTWPHKRFVRDYFAGRSELLEWATTDESYRRIVDCLSHPVQQALVQAPDHGNHLVLAGPGSGKTRVIVHRMAWLVRVRRVAPSRIIALAFNRGAALILRQRLRALIGDDSRGIAVMTYHAMAMRITGTSLAGAERSGMAIDFDRLLRDATMQLRGDLALMADADEARDRLLRGYEYIFVDEYQDIDEPQYAMVGALAGRFADADARLNIMAVGDDDQNIYASRAPMSNSSAASSAITEVTRPSWSRTFVRRNTSSRRPIM